MKVALARLGAVQNPLIPILREREVGFITRQVGTEVMITTERWRGFDHGALARELAADQGFSVILTDLDTDPGSVGGRMRLAQGDPATLGPPPSADDAPVRWIYTSSGTTADPKGIRHTDRSVMHSATGPVYAMAASPRRRQSDRDPHLAHRWAHHAHRVDRVGHAPRPVRVLRSRDEP